MRVNRNVRRPMEKTRCRVGVRLRGECLESRCLLAADVELLKDINTHPLNLEGFAPIVSMGDVVYFAANDGTHGAELWRTDGTPAGTQLIKDGNPGRGGLDLRSFTRVGNSIYFAATHPSSGRELWTSDGTAAGTQLVTDLWPGQNGSFPLDMIGYANKLYFTATSPQFAGVFETNGTAAGTKPFTGVLPEGWNTTYRLAHAVYQEKLYLTIVHAEEDVVSYAMLRTDGTPAGTEVVANNLRMDFERSAELNGTLYVANNIDDTSGEIWKTDGVNGFVKVTTNQTFGVVDKLISAGDRLYFVVGGQLWTSDGTDAGTQLLADSIPETYAITPVGNQLFFPRQLPDIGYELWVTDGTTGGTHLVKDIVEGPADSLSGVRFVVDGTLRFVSIENGVYRLWLSDGTEAGTQPLKTLALGEMGIGGNGVVLDSGLAVIPMGVETQGMELWTSDGTEAGTVAMTTQLPMTQGANPSLFIQAGNLQFFTANDGDHGRELWVTDGTTEGTHLVKDVMPGAANAFGNRFTDMEAAAVGNTLYFVASDGVHGRELWKTDGTEAGTSMVKDIWEGAGDAVPSLGLRSQLLNLNGALLFSARDRDGHGVLWRTDGTEAGTGMLSNQIAAEWMHVVGNEVYFQGVASSEGGEQGLYRTDGTPEGTIYVSAGIDMVASYLADLNGIVFFRNGYGGELWKSDGTAAGTVLVKDVNPGEAESLPLNPTAYQNAIYFLAKGPDGHGLWKTDGTEVGTVIVKLLPPQADNRPPDSLQVGEGSLYFYYDFKLWRSDGTEAGTQAISNNGIVSLPQIASQNGQVYYVVDLPGQQALWSSGTGGAQDVGLPGTLSDLAVLAASDGKLFFAATGPIGSGEIWVGRFTDPLPGDANGDGKVDLTDFGILKNNFGTGMTQAQGDFDGNGRVDLTDFGIFKQAFAAQGAVARVADPMRPASLHTAVIDQALAALALAMADAGDIDDPLGGPAFSGA